MTDFTDAHQYYYYVSVKKLPTVLKKRDKNAYFRKILLFLQMLKLLPSKHHYVN